MAEQVDRTISERARAALRAAHRLGLTPSEQANAQGRDILQEELDAFGNWDGAQYNLDDATRDRLLAHARQDTAATLILAARAFREAEKAHQISKQNRFLLLSLAILAAFSLVALLLGR